MTREPSVRRRAARRDEARRASISLFRRYMLTISDHVMLFSCMITETKLDVSRIKDTVDVVTLRAYCAAEVLHHYVVNVLGDDAWFGIRMAHGIPLDQSRDSTRMFSRRSHYKGHHVKHAIKRKHFQERTRKENAKFNQICKQED